MSRLLVIALVTAVVSVVLCAGCAMPFKSSPSGSQFAAAEQRDLCGREPSNPEATIRAYLQRALKDPDSLRDLSVGTFSPGYLFVAGGLLVPETLQWGWVGVGAYNAKNSYGGYVGLQAHEFLIHSDAVIYDNALKNGSFLRVIE